MRLSFPRIMITVADKKDDCSSTGRLNCLSLGFGIHQAWIYCAMYGGPAIFRASNLSLSIGTLAVSLHPATFVFYLSIIFFAATLLFTSITDQKFLTIFVSKKTLVASAALMSIGTLAMFTLDSVGWVAVIFSGITTGIGSGLLIAYWGTAFARHNTITIIINTAVAIAIAVGIYSVVIHYAPYGISGALITLFPLIDLIFLWQLTPIPYSKRHTVPIFNPLPIKKRRFAARFGVPVFIFGFSLGALRAVSMQIALPSPDVPSQLMAWTAASLATIIMLITIFATGKEREWDFFFRALIPFIALAIMMLPFIQRGDTLIVNLLLFTGFICFEALMWIFFAELSQRFRISPIFVFGLGRGFLALGALAGSLFIFGVPGYSLMNPLDGKGLDLIFLVAMLVAYAFLPRQREIGELIKPSDAFNENLLVRINEEDPEIEEMEEDEEQRGNKTRFRHQCEIISNRYLLSRRETEVLFHLAKGYNAAYIQEKLFISKSTAKTHIGNIYKKLDIHTQQELLRMIDDVKNEPES